MAAVCEAALTEAQIEEFNRQGFLVLRHLYSPQEVAELRDVFMAQAEGGPIQGLSDTNWNTPADDPLAWYPRMMNPHSHPALPVGPLAMRYLLDRRLEAVLRDLFGEEAVAAQSMFYFKPPGSRGQDLHQDNFYLRVKPGTCVAAWLAIDDAGPENGGMVVVPGSNNTPVVCPEAADPSLFFTTDHVPVPPGLEETAVDLKAGDVLFFNGSLIHGSYPNTSADRFRRAFICHYLPRRSDELANWYKALTFDGEFVSINEAIGGGPCGTAQPMAKGPH